MLPPRMGFFLFSRSRSSCGLTGRFSQIFSGQEDRISIKSLRRRSPLSAGQCPPKRCISCSWARRRCCNSLSWASALVQATKTLYMCESLASKRLNVKVSSCSAPDSVFAWAATTAEPAISWQTAVNTLLCAYAYSSFRCRDADTDSRTMALVAVLDCAFIFS